MKRYGNLRNCRTASTASEASRLAGCPHDLQAGFSCENCSIQRGDLGAPSMLTRDTMVRSRPESFMQRQDGGYRDFGKWTKSFRRGESKAARFMLDRFPPPRPAMPGPSLVLFRGAHGLGNGFQNHCEILQDGSIRVSRRTNVNFSASRVRRARSRSCSSRSSVSEMITTTENGNPASPCHTAGIWYGTRIRRFLPAVVLKERRH